MKRLHFYLGLAVFVGTLLSVSWLAGCKDKIGIVEPNDPREQLIKSPADWIEKYGDSLESQQTANIVLAIQVINRQGKAIKQLNERLVILEKTADPNGAK